MVTVMSAAYAAPHRESAPQPVLILCADEGIAGELIRDLAGRHYQPLVARPNWSWQAALEWARPVAAVVDSHHPAAQSDRFLAASDDLEVGLVLFGELPTGGFFSQHRRVYGVVATVATVDAQLIGGAVDATVRRRAG